MYVWTSKDGCVGFCVWTVSECVATAAENMDIYSGGGGNRRKKKDERKIEGIEADYKVKLFRVCALPPVYMRVGIYGAEVFRPLNYAKFY